MQKQGLITAISNELVEIVIYRIEVQSIKAPIFKKPPL